MSTKGRKLAKPKEQMYTLLPEWTMRQAEQSLILSGGADARYEIELEGNGPSFFASLKHGKPFSRSDLQAHDQRVLEELITAEVVVPELQKGKLLRVAIIGGNTGFALPEHGAISIVKNSQAYDLALIIRTNSTYADLLEAIGYPGITKPQLFADMAFHHTFSLGPLVFPGETACIACLQGRVSTRWGDEAPPPLPQVVKKNGGLIAELVATELARIANGDTSLTNKTVSWNFEDRTVRRDQLLKVPLCPICTQNKIDQAGALALPWGKDESASHPV